MSKFNKYFLMNTEDVKEYVVDVVKYFDKNEKIECFEIGDGNINYVFRVIGKNKSIIVKQSDILLRSSQRPLDTYRSKIEAEILKIQKNLSSKHIPEVYMYDENMNALSMEDISEYKNMRKELIDEKIYINFSDEISLFLANTLLPTTDLVLSRDIKKDYVKFFINKELCDITEDLVLTEPYYNYKNRNIISKGQEKFVEENLYKNEKLKIEVAKLRDKFMNYSQALIHGDLHTGSIFINENGIKIIDPEFAFYGPIGYDIGNVIGNLFFNFVNKIYYSNNNNFIEYIKNTIIETYDKTLSAFNKKYDDIIEFPLYKEKDFKTYYISNIFSDALGYAGTEIIRRTVGDSKVFEISSIDLDDKKIEFERSLINIGIYLIMNREKIKTGKEIIDAFYYINSQK